MSAVSDEAGSQYFSIGSLETPNPPVVFDKKFDAAFFKLAAAEAKDEEGNSNSPFSAAVIRSLFQLPGFNKKMKTAINFGPLPQGIQISDKEVQGFFVAVGSFLPKDSVLRYVEDCASESRPLAVKNILEAAKAWRDIHAQISEGKLVVTAVRGAVLGPTVPAPHEASRPAPAAAPAPPQSGPPPPPPPPAPAAPPASALPNPTPSSPIFKVNWELDTVSFPDGFGESGARWTPPILGGAVRTMTSIRNMKASIPMSALLFKLGRLRALQWECGNAARKEGADEYERFVQTRALEQLYGLGWMPPEPTVPGLPELIAAVEEWAADDLAGHRLALQANQVTFDALAELYRPGSRVVRRVSGLEGEMLAMLVRNCWYEEHKTLFGPQRSFHISLEFFVSAGQEFVVCAFDDVLSDWTGPRTFSELEYQPLSETSPHDKAVLAHLQRRGALFAEVGVGTHFMECPDRNFIPRRAGQRGLAVRGARRGGSGVSRVMIDVERGIAEGAMGLVDGEAHSYAVQAALKGHRFLSQQRSREDDIGKAAGAGGDGGGGEYRGCVGVFRSLPESERWRSWPAVVGFNFASKTWGMVVLESLQAVRFQDELLGRLVLAEDVKMLVRAFVAQHRLSSFNDVLAGKRGASVVLMHGPPGVGKTLTAEAMAESFHKPLYPISMGELGETSREVEQKLGEVLELCAAWDCIMLIDEADTILEKREAFDIAKNAVVCVMLRLLEYHDGVVFLTTNRIDRFDPAVLSRVTISIAYSDLDAAERERVWRLLLASSGVEEGSLDVGKVAADHPMNGREIKNTLRLAMALAADQGVPLSTSLLTKVVGAVLKGRC